MTYHTFNEFSEHLGKPIRYHMLPVICDGKLMYFEMRDSLFMQIINHMRRQQEQQEAERKAARLRSRGWRRHLRKEKARNRHV